MKLKIPKLTIKRPDFLKRKPAKSIKLNAATARMRAEDDFDDEPQTRLSSAFFVVLILHVVAVGGIYAFNSIKAHRRGLEPSSTSSASAKPVIEKTVATEQTASLKAPAQEIGSKPAPATAPTQVATMAAPGARFYHVKQGDTLSKVAQQTGVTVAALQMMNKDTATLRPGQILNLPTKSTSSAALAVIDPPAPNPTTKKAEPAVTKPATSSAPGTYEVQKKDTATSIAKRFNVSVDELLKVNKISDPTKLRLGAKLTIPAKKN